MSIQRLKKDHHPLPVGIRGERLADGLSTIAKKKVEMQQTTQRPEDPEGLLREFQEARPEIWRDVMRRKREESSRRYKLGQKRKRRKRGG